MSLVNHNWVTLNTDSAKRSVAVLRVSKVITCTVVNGNNNTGDESL